MYRELSYAEFAGLVAALCEREASGVLFFVSDGESWGKLLFDAGRIVGLGFKMMWGPPALEAMRGLASVKLDFHPKVHSSAARVNGGKEQPADWDTEAILQGLCGVGRVSPPQDLLESLIRAGDPPQGRGPRRASAAPTVLVVDDSRIARKAAVQPLLQAGFRVVEAKDGFEAMGQIQNESPDLVVLDLIMPGIDGYKVLELLRKSSQFRALPVIILTSRDGLLDRLKGRLRRTDEYLTKPFAGEELLALVTKYLSAPAMGLA